MPTIAPFVGVFLVGIPVTVNARWNSVWDKLQVKEDGIRLNIVSRSGGYTNPYRIKFKEDSVLSVYKFERNGCVTSIKVGSERYEPVYDSSGDLTNVIRMAERKLAGDGE